MSSSEKSPATSATPSPHPPKRFNFAVPFILVSGLLGIAGFLLLRSTAQSGVAERKNESRANLALMAQLLKAAGYPDDPNAAIASHPEAAINPSWPEQIGYVYVSGIHSTDPESSVVLFENVPPEKQKLGRLVARLDGTVELLTEGALQERLHAMEARWSAEHRPWRKIPIGRDHFEEL
jgi:hypothetical protein